MAVALHHLQPELQVRVFSRDRLNEEVAYSLITRYLQVADTYKVGCG